MRIQKLQSWVWGFDLQRAYNTLWILLMSRLGPELLSLVFNLEAKITCFHIFRRRMQFKTATYNMPELNPADPHSFVKATYDDVIVYSVNKYLTWVSLHINKWMPGELCWGLKDLLALLFFIITIALRNMRISSSLWKTNKQKKSKSRLISKDL